jgi:molybdenum cofactor guanylyltransferase
MGRPKHLLQIGDRTFLDHCVDALKRVVDQVVVSVAFGQSISNLDPDVTLVKDELRDNGPLAGLASALSAKRTDVAAVISCDAPLVRPALLQFLFDAIGDNDAAFATVSGREHYFPGVYRGSTGELAMELLGRGERRMSALVGRCRCVVVPEHHIKSLDPELGSFTNVNSPADYEVLIRRAAYR